MYKPFTFIKDIELPVKRMVSEGEYQKENWKIKAGDTFDLEVEQDGDVYQAQFAEGEYATIPEAWVVEGKLGDAEVQRARLEAARQYLQESINDLEGRAAYDMTAALIDNWRDAVEPQGREGYQTGKGDTVDEFIKADVGDTIGQFLMNVAMVKAMADGWEPDPNASDGFPPKEAMDWVRANVRLQFPNI